MFKKISSIILMSAMLLIGGVFQPTADAAAGADHAQSNYSKGDWNSFGVNNWQNQLNVYFNQWYNSKWDFKYTNKGKNNKQEDNNDQEKVEQPKQEDKVEQPEQEESKPVEQAPEKESADNIAELEQLNAYEQEVFDLTNKKRVNQGLAPFQVDLELSRVAREKSRDMLGSNYFDHNSPTYGSPFDMMKSYGITYRTAGENIAKGQRTPEEVVSAWMNSPGHRENIFNSNFTHIGIGYVEQGNHWTQQFIGK